MREIKFRGKRVDKDVLVYGDLIHGEGSKSGKIYILPQTQFYPSGCHNLDGYEVIPETAGQFTGLKDRDGKEIFEGDMFKIGLEPNIFEVRFEHAAFLAYENGEQVGLIGELFTNICKVVGNVHDNQEFVNTNV